MDHLVTSTPTVGGASPKLSFEDASIVADPKGKRKAVNLALILEAVEAVGVKKKGASLQAIKKYIEGTLSQPLDKRIITAIKRSVMKGIESGQLMKASASQNAIGVNGHFLISKTSKVKKMPSSPKEQVSDSEAVLKPKKARKINLSDSAIHDFKTKRKLNVTKMPKSKKDEKENVKPTASKTKNSKATQLDSEVDSSKKSTAQTKSANERGKKSKDIPESEAAKKGNEEVKAVKRRERAKSAKGTAEDKTKAKPDTESVKDKAVAKTRKGKTEDKPVESKTEEVKRTRGRPAKKNIEEAKPTKGKAESKANVNTEEGKKPKGKEQPATKSKPNKVPKITEVKAATDEDEDASAEELDAVFNEEEIEVNDYDTDLPKTLNYAQDTDDKFGSDSEFVVKKPNRKSLKSYSSDTEVDNAHETKKGKGKNVKSKVAKDLDVDPGVTTGKVKKLFKPEVKDVDLKNTRAKRSKK